MYTLDCKVTTDFLNYCDKMLKSIGHFVKLNSFPASIYKIKVIRQVIHLSKHQLGEKLWGACAPLFAPTGAFRRLLTPCRLAGKGCQSGAGWDLGVLGGVRLGSVGCTGQGKPAGMQRVLVVRS